MSKLDLSDRKNNITAQLVRTKTYADALAKAQAPADPAAKAAALYSRAGEIYQFADKIQDDVLNLGGDPQPVISQLIGVGDRERFQADALLAAADEAAGVTPATAPAVPAPVG